LRLVRLPVFHRWCFEVIALSGMMVTMNNRREEIDRHGHSWV
jgi:hypothetical protein